VERQLRLEADEFLHKPVDLARLRHVLEHDARGQSPTASPPARAVFANGNAAATRQPVS
jgi:hypothetical protein